MASAPEPSPEPASAPAPESTTAPEPAPSPAAEPKPRKPLKRDPIFLFSIALIVIGSFLMLIRPPDNWEQVKENMDRELVTLIIGEPASQQDNCSLWRRNLLVGHWEFRACFGEKNAVTSRERHWKWGL